MGSHLVRLPSGARDAYVSWSITGMPRDGIEFFFSLLKQYGREIEISTSRNS